MKMSEIYKNKYLMVWGVKSLLYIWKLLIFYWEYKQKMVMTDFIYYYFFFN
jgi:hypothetical protein